MRRFAPLMVLGLFLGQLVVARDARAQATPLCFDVPGVSQCIHEQFRAYWEENGGLPVFGYPISAAAMQQTSQGMFLTQYFERNRFELHPDRPRPYHVLLGRLGDEQLVQQGRAWTTFPRGEPASTCLFFAETGHSICDQEPNVGFRSYWLNHGLQAPGLSDTARSLALFGLPLSEPTLETNAVGDTVLTQWFERARFEWHPNNPDRFKVLLGLLGTEVTANLVSNGDFEAPLIGPSYKTYAGGQVFGRWGVSHGSIDLKGPRWQAVSGVQSVDLNGNEAGGLVQDVYTVPGQAYRLRFAMAGNPVSEADYQCTPGTKQMVVTWGDTAVLSPAFDTVGRTSTNLGWGYLELTAIATTASTRLAFSSETPNNQCGPMIDDVSVRQVTP